MKNADSQAADVVDAFVCALSKLDLGALSDLLAVDAVWDVMGADFLAGGQHRFAGREHILGDFLANTVGLAFDLTKPFKVLLDHYHVVGGVAIAEWRIQATAAKGRPYENHYCLIFETEDGKIRTVREYVNTEYAKRVLFDEDE